MEYYDRTIRICKEFYSVIFGKDCVGVGEAGSNPSAYSILSDYFPESKRATAFSFYGGGAFLGIIIGYLMGGYLNQIYGWRITFICLGFPGALFALFIFLMIKEPVRGGIDTKTNETKSKLTFKESVKSIFKNKSYIYLCLAYGANLFSFYGTNNWMPSFLSRLHGMNTIEIGEWLALIVGISGMVGSIVGGKLADKYTLLNTKYYLWLPIIANVICIPFMVLVFLSPNKLIVLLAYIIPSFLNTMFLCSAIALVYKLVVPELKALATSFFILIVNLLGISIGPLVIGLISDAFKPSLGINSLRVALFFTLIVSIVSILLFFKSAKYLEGDLERMEK